MECAANTLKIGCFLCTCRGFVCAELGNIGVGLPYIGRVGCRDTDQSMLLAVFTWTVGVEECRMVPHIFLGEHGERYLVFHGR